MKGVFFALTFSLSIYFLGCVSGILYQKNKSYERKYYYESVIDHSVVEVINSLKYMEVNYWGPEGSQTFSTIIEKGRE